PRNTGTQSPGLQSFSPACLPGCLPACSPSTRECTGLRTEPSRAEHTPSPLATSHGGGTRRAGGGGEAAAAQHEIKETPGPSNHEQQQQQQQEKQKQDPSLSGAPPPPPPPPLGSACGPSSGGGASLCDRLRVGEAEVRHQEMDSNGKPSTVHMVLLATSFSPHSRLLLYEAKQVPIDPDLKKYLSDIPGRCVPYAVVEGVVKSVKETLNSQYVDNCKGVIERLTLKEQKMKLILPAYQHGCPLDLAGAHGDEEAVSGGRGAHSAAAGTPLSWTWRAVYENFHPAVAALSNAIGHFISGERPKGVRETEEMLRWGESVTAVGELVLTTTWHEGRVRVWRAADAGGSAPRPAPCCCCCCGAATRAPARPPRRGSRAGVQGATEEAHAGAGRGRGGGGGARSLQRVPEPGGAPASSLECGHVCACEPCYQALPQPKKCPICRAPIDRVVPLYNS
ncbi:hypothetical protein CRUP_013867, partial [Coryphaenoides rupestris]